MGKIRALINSSPNYIKAREDLQDALGFIITSGSFSKFTNFSKYERYFALTYNTPPFILKERSGRLINDFFEVYPYLVSQRPSIIKAIDMIYKAFKFGNKLLVCGNGGSSADSDHIATELLKGFLLKRPINNTKIGKLLTSYYNKEEGEKFYYSLQGALPVISLSSNSSFITACGNDQGYDAIFAQQVLAYGKDGDILLVLTTSGESKNIQYATAVAKALGLSIICLTGQDGGKIGELCNCTIKAPDSRVFRIQEYHSAIYHLICAVVESEYFES